MMMTMMIQDLARAMIRKELDEEKETRAQREKDEREDDKDPGRGKAPNARKDHQGAARGALRTTILMNQMIQNVLTSGEGMKAVTLLR